MICQATQLKQLSKSTQTQPSQFLIPQPTPQQSLITPTTTLKVDGFDLLDDLTVLLKAEFKKRLRLTYHAKFYIIKIPH